MCVFGHLYTIPNILTYQQCVDCGASALFKEREIDESDWFLVKHFKMHLHPRDVIERNELPLESMSHLKYSIINHAEDIELCRTTSWDFATESVF